MSVLVLGATGNVGPHVVSALHQLGVQRPRVVVRDAARADRFFGDAADVITGDITDPAVISRATDGIDSVLLLSPHSFSMADLQLRVIRETRRSGVRIVKISGTSSAIRADGPHACRQHWEVERVLADSGQPFVILRPNSFMQVLIGQLLLPSLRTTGVVPNPIADAGISFVDARDVADVAAHALTRHDWDGETLVLTGPRSISYRQLADLVSGRSDGTAAVVDVTPDDVRATLIGRGMAPWEADHFREMYQLFRDGESEFVTTTIHDVTGHAARSVEAFLDEQFATAAANAPTA
jgi:uncharacterized protein YbjT (DUF2867 family)